MTELWLLDGGRDPTKLRQEPRFAIGRPDCDVILVPDEVDDDARTTALTVDFRYPAPVSDASPLFNLPIALDDEEFSANLSQVPDDTPLIPPTLSTDNSVPAPTVSELRGVSSDFAGTGTADSTVTDILAESHVTTDNVNTYNAELANTNPTDSLSIGPHNLPVTATSRYGLRSHRSDWRSRCFQSIFS
jgi:hypothetical protein